MCVFSGRSATINIFLLLTPKARKDPRVPAKVPTFARVSVEMPWVCGCQGYRSHAPEETTPRKNTENRLLKKRAGRKRGPQKSSLFFRPLCFTAEKMHEQQPENSPNSGKSLNFSQGNYCTRPLRAEKKKLFSSPLRLTFVIFWRGGVVIEVT